MRLVNVRCRIPECRALLGWFDEAPPANDRRWEIGMIQVRLCGPHGEGAGHGNVRAWQDRQRRAGRPTDRVEHNKWVYWRELRPAVEKARQTGRTQTFLT